MIRAGCMMANFGPDAPYYRRPKRIITQHFILQNNGDFISKFIYICFCTEFVYHFIKFQSFFY